MSPSSFFNHLDVIGPQSYQTG